MLWNLWYNSNRAETKSFLATYLGSRYEAPHVRRYLGVMYVLQLVLSGWEVFAFVSKTYSHKPRVIDPLLDKITVFFFMYMYIINAIR